MPCGEFLTFKQLVHFHQAIGIVHDEHTMREIYSSIVWIVSEIRNANKQ